jgi:hypothetical protein
MFPRGNFFGARVSVGVWVFLFATELTTEMGFTDDCYTDGRDPSVSPSVLFSPTDFIAVTNGINPSVKLDNVVVSEHANYMKICCINYLNSVVNLLPDQLKLNFHLLYIFTC